MNSTHDKNVDTRTVDGFGDEWERLDQTGLSGSDAKALFDSYFSIFPWNSLPTNAVGYDLGCGSGRWAKFVAPRVGRLYCIDPSSAIEVARKNLQAHKNCEFHAATADEMPMADGSMDFGYSLGVLHHIPDTRAALIKCVSKLKPGAPFLVYLYYAFDNRPFWFRKLWHISELIRRVISELPHGLRYHASQIIAALIYWPLARIAKLLEKVGFEVSHFPLSAYRDRGFYVMRTDALDRFGTRLEQRFTRVEITQMMEAAGLENVVFRTSVPFWCAMGYKKVDN